MNRRNLPDFIAVAARLLQRNLARDCDLCPEIERLLTPLEVEAVLSLIESAAEKLSEDPQAHRGAR